MNELIVMEKVRISQKIIVSNEENKLLTLRRSSTAPSHPLKWDLPGGGVEIGEDPEKSIERELTEETGIKVQKAKPFDAEAHFNEKGEYWFTVAWEARTDNSKVTLSFEHDQFKWVTREEFLKLQTEEKLKRFVNNLP